MYGDISTTIIVVILVIVCIFSVKSYVKKVRSGCCGSGSERAEKKVKAADRDKRHYPYAVSAGIEGMVCGNCAARVENAFNSMEGVWAKVDLSKKRALIRSKAPLEEAEIKSTVRKLGYTVMRIEEIPKE